MAKIISITKNRDSALKEGLELLTRGKLVSIPTETVYGLAADATQVKAITAIYQTKKRPQFNPLICHMSSLEMARQYAIFDPLSEKLASYFWPGPLTIIVPLKPDCAIDKLAIAGLDSVGIRVPKGFACELIAAFGKPLAAPSANRSGRVSPTSANHVRDELGAKIDLILDNGPCQIGVESSIVKVDGDKVYLLRKGGIPAQAIEKVLNTKLLRSNSDHHDKIEAPGMLAAHYAPRAKMRLNATHVLADEALITFGHFNVEGAADVSALFNLSPEGNLDEAAYNLFDMLIRADKSGVETIAVCPIPDIELGEAINDRLKRAAIRP